MKLSSTFRQSLDSINQKIIKEMSEPSISFEEYYKQYLMDIQDYCLDLEAEYQLKNQSLTDQYRIIDQAYSEVLKNDINNTSTRII